MSIGRLLRQPAPRMFIQKRIRDIRGRGRGCVGDSIAAFDSVELLDSFAVHANRVSVPQIRETNALIHLSKEIVPDLFKRSHELIHEMDSVLIVRLFSYLQKMEEVPTDDYQNLLNACVPRLGEFTIQQLVRMMFAVSVARKRQTVDTSLFSEFCFKYLDISKLGQNTPPRLVSKLIVSTALLADSHQQAALLPGLERLVVDTLNSMQPDQVQQVAFGFGRMGAENCTCAIISHALDITPIRDTKTYSALLISLRRLKPALPVWDAFKKVYCDSIGLSLSEPHVSEIASLLPRESDILHRRIRNALVY